MIDLGKKKKYSFVEASTVNNNLLIIYCDEKECHK